MAGVNKATVLGNVGGAPEIRTTTSGVKVATFSVATSEQWRDKNTGEKREVTDWHYIVVWNEHLVKTVEQYVKKGSKVYIEGAMKTREWTDQGGVKRWKTEVVLKSFSSQIVLLDKREGVPPVQSQDDYGTSRTRDDSISSGGAGKRNDMDDEIPF